MIIVWVKKTKLNETVFFHFLALLQGEESISKCFYSKHDKPLKLKACQCTSFMNLSDSFYSLVTYFLDGFFPLIN